MRRALLWVADHPAGAAAAICVGTLFLLVQIPRLEIDMSAEGFMVASDPGRQYYDRARRTFGSDELTIVLVKADDVFTARVLGLIRELSDSLARLDGVSRVDSLTTVRGIRGDGDTIDLRPLVGPRIPTDSAALARVRRDALGNRVMVGNVVSASGSAAAILLYTDPPLGDRAFNRRLTDQIEDLIGRHTTPGVTVYQLGLPLLKATYARYLVRDLLTLIPLSFAVLFLTLLLVGRSVQMLVIPLTTAALGLIWGFGLMALVGIPLNVLTATIAPLLVTIGSAEDVHMLGVFRRRLARGDDQRAAVRAMVGETALPIVVTTATTAVGFGSLVLSDVTMLIQFGGASALALTGNFVITVALLPVLTRAIPVGPERGRGAVRQRPDRVAQVTEWAGRIVLARGRTILAGTAILCALGLAGVARMEVDTDFIEYFPDDSFLPVRTRDIRRALSGSGVFYLVVETGREGGATSPELLRSVAGLQRFLADTGRADTSVSVADYVMKLHRELNGGDPRFESVPDSPDQIAQHLLLLDPPELARFVDSTYSTANVVVRHHVTGSSALRGLLDEIDAYVRRSFPPGVVVRATGEGILINNAADYMAVNEITSLVWTLAVIGVIHAGLFMSAAVGLISLVPNVVPVLLTYGLMGALGIPLNTGTALVAMIAIGIAVDDTVHHVVTYSRRLSEDHVPSLAMFSTLREVAWPVTQVSMALAAGFLVTALSSFVLIAWFGLLAAFTMMTAWLTELMLTPVLMIRTRPITSWDLLQLTMDPALLFQAPAFQGLSRRQVQKVILSGRTCRVRAGETILGTGPPIVVLAGALRVSRSSENAEAQRSTTLTQGAVLDGRQLEPGATVIATVASDVFILDLTRLRRRFPLTAARLRRNLRVQPAADREVSRVSG